MYDTVLATGRRHKAGITYGWKCGHRFTDNVLCIWILKAHTGEFVFQMEVSEIDFMKSLVLELTFPNM